MNRARTTLLTAERLRELLSYDPVTGIFTWRVDRGGNAKRGSVAGSPNSDGYIQIKIDGVLHKAHRLAWLYVHGTWPDEQIDHRIGDRSDNRISELRPADFSENACNRGLRSDNKSGVPGVHWDREAGKWNVRVQKSGKRILVGRFHSLTDAIAARRAYSEFVQGEYSGMLRDV